MSKIHLTLICVQSLYIYTMCNLYPCVLTMKKFRATCFQNGVLAVSGYEWNLLTFIHTFNKSAVHSASRSTAVT